MLKDHHENATSKVQIMGNSVGQMTQFLLKKL